MLFGPERARGLVGIDLRRPIVSLLGTAIPLGLGKEIGLRIPPIGGVGRCFRLGRAKAPGGDSRGALIGANCGTGGNGIGGVGMCLGTGKGSAPGRSGVLHPLPGIAGKGRLPLDTALLERLMSILTGVLERDLLVSKALLVRVSNSKALLVLVSKALLALVSKALPALVSKALPFLVSKALLDLVSKALLVRVSKELLAPSTVLLAPSTLALLAPSTLALLAPFLVVSKASLALVDFLALLSTLDSSLVEMFECLDADLDGAFELVPSFDCLDVVLNLMLVALTLLWPSCVNDLELLLVPSVNSKFISQIFIPRILDKQNKFTQWNKQYLNTLVECKI